MPKQIRILRLLEYSGNENEIKEHLGHRAVKGQSPANWNRGLVSIKESFLSNELGPWEMPPVEEEVSDGYSIARRHLDAIDQAEVTAYIASVFNVPTSVFGMPDAMALSAIQQAYADMATSPATQSTNPKG